MKVAPARHFDDSPQFPDLARLDAKSWRLLLRTADPEVARLALTGASPALIRQALAWLPKEERQRTLQRLEHPGPVSLRELDAAREELLELAIELEEEGRLRLPRGRAVAA